MLGAALGAVWFCAAARAQAPAQAPQQAPGGAAKAGKEKEETCRISGMVVKLADGTPLKGATVVLSNDEDREHTIAAKTTADGRFALKNVPPAHYKMTVSKNGYVGAEYGQQKPSDPGATLTLSAGQVKEELMFRLMPSAVIAGRVFNGDGEPEPNASVTASRQTYHEGRRQVSMIAEAQTDDLGAYRLFGLPPGRYFVSAVPQRWGQITGDKEFSENAGAKGSEQGYTKTYYPGTPDPGRAAAISLKEGEEIPGTDIALKEVAVRRVRGRAVNQASSKGNLQIHVQLMPRTNGQDWEMGGFAGVKKEDGSFEIANVVPGAYTVIAFWFDPNESKTHMTSQKVDVGESDLDGLLLTIGAGGVVQGRVVWDGKPSQEREDLSVGAEAVDGGFLGNQRARVDEKREFTLKNLADGELRLVVYGAAKDCYVKQIAFGQTLAKDDVISLAKGSNSALEITLSSRGARVQGSVTDKDGLPAAGVWVVAVPEENRRSLSRLFKAQTTDQYGNYELHGLAPGSYRIFAWAGIEQGEWEDAEFLRPQETKGELLELQDEDVKTVNLQVIEKKRVGAE
jgi:hypothetical protein